MLIKFLSFAASAILGSSRHKAAIVSCSTVALAIAGVIGLTIYHSGQPSDAASTATSNGAGQEDTIWLQAHEVDNKDQYAEQTEPENTPEQPTRKPDKPEDKPANNTGELPEQTISVSSSEVILAPGGNSDIILARISSSETVADWTVSAGTGENGNSTGLSITNTEKADSYTTFRIRVAKDALPGTYYVTVQATFADSSLPPLSKAIEVTVQAVQ